LGKLTATTADETGFSVPSPQVFTAEMAALKSAQLASLIFIISFSIWICRNFTNPIQFVPEDRVTAVCNTIPINFLFTALSLCDKIKNRMNGTSVSSQT